MLMKNVDVVNSLVHNFGSHLVTILCEWYGESKGDLRAHFDSMEDDEEAIGVFIADNIGVLSIGLMQKHLYSTEIRVPHISRFNLERASSLTASRLSAVQAGVLSVSGDPV